MKNYIIIFLLGFLFFSGCSSDPVSPPETNKQSGNILFSIDKENAPEGIVVVTAYLSRFGFQTISSSLNLLSDSTADISITNIPAGEWNLKVDAMDINGLVVYTGESNVNILEAFTLQVSLTLYPAGNGTGNIYIYVNWGTPSKWTDYSGSPILTQYNTPGNPFQISECKIIFDQGKYKMYYNGVFSGGRSNIYYAESNDGINWYFPFPNPVLTPGIGSWDSKGVAVGAVIKVDSSYLMFYSGTDLSDYQQIGLAFSPDGISWTKRQLPAVPQPLEFTRFAVQSAVKVEDKYFLYFGGVSSNMNQVSVNVGVSTDLVNWEITYRILDNAQPWESSFAAYGAVNYDNDKFIMIYQNSSATAFGEAYSYDGINWSKSGSNPIVSVRRVNNLWCEQISYPCLFIKDDISRIYYTGSYPNGIGFFQ